MEDAVLLPISEKGGSFDVLAALCQSIHCAPIGGGGFTGFEAHAEPIRRLLESLEISNNQTRHASIATPNLLFVQHDSVR
jgi:hypothetical protein